MISARSVTRGLLIASTAVGGLMGSLLDRAVVATPAWRKLGPVAWPPTAGTPTWATGRSCTRPATSGWPSSPSPRPWPSRLTARATAIPVYLQAAFMAAVMALTIKAAPVMDSIARLSQAGALRHAFGQFTLWGIYLRGAAVILAFLCSVWALAVISRAPRAPEHGTVPADRGTATSPGADPPAIQSTQTHGA